MKTIMNQITKDDLLTVDVFDLSRTNQQMMPGSHIMTQPDEIPPLFKKDLLRYRKCDINLRQVIDYCEHIIEVEVYDEKLFPEWKKRYDEHMEKIKGFGPVVSLRPANVFSGEMELTGNEEQGAVSHPGFFHERPPMETITISATAIVYFNSIMRVVMMEISDFREMYHAYLTKQKVDI